MATSMIAGPVVGMWAAAGAIAGALGGAIASGWPPPRRGRIRQDAQSAPDVQTEARYVVTDGRMPMPVIIEEETGPANDTGAIEAVPGALLVGTSPEWVYWDDVVDEADMAAMWGRAEIRKQWTAAGERPGGRVRFSRDAQMRPFLTKLETMAVAELTVDRHFRGEVKPSLLVALAEITSKRLLHGQQGTGLMQTELQTVQWLASCSPRYGVFSVASAADLSRPFVSMFYGAAYVHWLSRFEGKVQGEEFIVRGYVGGPNGSRSAETLPFWESYLKVNEGHSKRWWGS